MQPSAEIAVHPAIAPPPRRRRFIAHHHWDRNFFLIFLGICWLGVLMGFTPAAMQRYSGHADYPAPLILKMHAFAFSAWMALLTTQILLIRTRRPLIHMKLGLVGVALIPLMATSAFLSELYSQRFRLTHPPDSQAFFIIAIFYVVAFTSLATAALVARKTPGAHKRLILLATTIIVGAAYTRWLGGPIYNLVGDGYGGMLLNTYTGTNLILIGAVSYDWLTRHRLHPVYEVAVPAILAGEIASTIIYHSPAWLPVARTIVGR